MADVVNELKCAKCGYTWQPKAKEPRECPQCKSRYWRGKKNDVRNTDG